MNLLDDKHWRAQHAYLLDLKRKAVVARDKPGLQGNQMRELQLFIAMSGLLELSWSMTEQRPGEAAGITLEEVPSEERLAIREKLVEAIELGNSLLSQIEA
ncbi:MULTISPECIES: hypothetical protein [Achromobacter]|uniref:hypothetical protein n=1 Tax=Achromobacter TaxID=222 RepID=UPI0023F733FE|nr:hypothetical protein [Achromobacter anxifer]MDF8364669.1 hypothetical protein [Achromobacter anxifer]